MILKGTVLRVEPVNGKDNNGQSYAYLRAHVLDGVDVHRCRVGDNFGQVGQGQEVIANVTVNAYNSRLSVTLVSPVTAAELDAIAA